MHIHILGICGTFMGGLAALAREAGHTVTGCDAGVYPPMSDQLRSLGVDVVEGYGADQIAPEIDMYVVGNVVSRARLADASAKFPLMEAILNQGLLYTSGPQWLSEHILQGRHVLAVAGTHGKTTTTSMLAWILESAGMQPGFLVGGVPLNFGVSARVGSRYFVIEADEYDTAFFDKRSKFVHYRPRTVVLNNLEFDHADIFDNLEAIERQFHHLIRTVPSDGQVVYNGLEESLQRVLHKGCWSSVTSFGTAASDIAAVGTHNDFEVTHRGLATSARVRWALSGSHNQMNALAAISAALHVGVPLAVSAHALASFQNVKRRMEVRGVAGGVTVYDDFAHHPTAIRLTLDGLRAQLDADPSTRDNRIFAAFEPRSNTMKLGTMKQQLPWSLEAADKAFCHTGGLDWDPAQALAPMGARAQTSTSVQELTAQIMAIVRPGDHVVCMSNGGFGSIHSALLTKLSTA